MGHLGAMLIAWSLGVVFLASSIPKLRSPKSFLILVLAYDVFPAAVARGCAALVPPMELTLGLLFLTGTAVRLAALASVALLTGFAVAVSINLRRGRDLECGCFGASSRKIGPVTLAEEFLLIAASAATAALGSGWAELAPWSPFVSGGLAGACSLALACACVARAVLWAPPRRAQPPFGSTRGRPGRS